MRPLLLLVAACSIPDLDLEGKQCPCTAGFACDSSTNLCRPVNGDGGIIDSPSATPCLPVGGSEIYRYAGTFDWQHEDSSWSGAAEIVQSSSNAMESYAFRTQAELTNAAGNYHVITALRITQSGAGSPSAGIVMRAQLSLQDKSRYACNWIPKNRELRLEVTKGGNTSTLGSTIIAEASQTAPVTMEAKIAGNSPAMLSCCLREYPTASMRNVPDAATPVMGGYPGLGTNRMAATFPSFVALTQ